MKEKGVGRNIIPEDRNGQQINSFNNGREPIAESVGVEEQAETTQQEVPVETKSETPEEHSDKNEKGVEAQQTPEKIRNIWTEYSSESHADHMSIDAAGTGWTFSDLKNARELLKNNRIEILKSKNNREGVWKPYIFAMIDKETNKVKEIRGAMAGKQEVNSRFLGMIKKRYGNRPEWKEKFEGKYDDMKRISGLRGKIKNGERLNKEELKFLYQVDRKIEHFGTSPYYDTSELTRVRNVKQDLSLATGIAIDRISLKTKETLMNPKIDYHYGKFLINEDVANSAAEINNMPMIVNGQVIIEHLPLKTKTLSLGEIQNRVGSGGVLNLNTLKTLQKNESEAIGLPEIIKGVMRVVKLNEGEIEKINFGKIKVEGKVFLNQDLSGQFFAELQEKFPHINFVKRNRNGNRDGNGQEVKKVLSPEDLQARKEVKKARSKAHKERVKEQKRVRREENAAAKAKKVAEKIRINAEKAQKAKEERDRKNIQNKRKGGGRRR